MEIIRKWYCSCRGKPAELTSEDPLEEEQGEPICSRCGASPSSDPKKTLSFKDFSGDEEL
ncbi:MAG: hypothetical protein C0615_10600 [Desulfuromonas sp.]|nr:MAG: hypothetical protein C0615_10600 [Desulfuromonas sp.]